MEVPFNDLNRIHAPLRVDFAQAFEECIENNYFIGGEWVSEFEAALSKEFEQRFIVGVSNGTDAISVALRALELPFGSEVITSANSWISSAEVITENRLEAVFADVDDSGQMSVKSLLESITDKTSAVVLPHLFGNMSSVDEITRICKENQIFLIEDCAQAHLSSFKGKLAGTWGDIATYSFYPGKNLGAIGDSGGIGTSNKDLVEKARAIANHGAHKKHNHLYIGTNARMNPLQAKVLLIKLPFLKEWTKQRQQIAKAYSEGLSDIDDIKFYAVNYKTRHSYHVFTILTDHRDELASYLKSNGIQTGIHYPKIIPDQKCYSKTIEYDKYCRAREFSNTNLSLPIFPGQTDDEIDYIIEKIKIFYEKS